MTEEARGEVRKKAVQGAAWTVALSLGTRVVQVLGTLAITYFLQRDVVGEVSNAALFALNAHMLTTFGVPTALSVRKSDPRSAFHATFALFVTGVLALVIAVALSGYGGGLLRSPQLTRYLLPLAVAVLLTRMASVPERMLQYRLRFRDAGLARNAGELMYGVVAVTAAFAGAGGWALVLAQVSRGAASLLAGSAFLHPREWAKPHRLDRSIFRELFAFGLPLGVALWLAFAARSLDNFVVSALFGTAIVGAYNLAYQLADIPATQIAEQIGDVLTSSFARLDGDARRAALPRSLALVALVVFPLAAGLGVAAPTVVATLLRAEWHSAGSMLAVLAVLSLARPIGWLIGAYLQATQRSRPIMWFSALRLAAVLTAVFGLGKAFGPIGACAGVGVGFSLHALANVAWIMKEDGFRLGELLGGVARVLIACFVLCAAVLAARRGWSFTGIQVRGVPLVVEVAAGALGYAVGLWLAAKQQAREAFRLLRDLRRDRAR